MSEFDDPRLVAIYDAVNPYDPGTQPEFYRWLAADIGAATIIDVGCGTGMITCQLAEDGYRMIGVEPSPLMLAIARGKRSDVEWVDGDVSRVGTPAADMAFMSGHVAQFFLTDDEWHAALVAVHTALRPGGTLAFESRNPAVREWETWTRDASWLVDDPVAGHLEVWSQVDDVSDDIVTYSNHYAFQATGDNLVAPGALRFRSAAALAQSLHEAGFVVERVYGDWDRRPAGPLTPELIVVATR